jgi:hypothetical protein
MSVEYTNWAEARFPFDRASCGFCMSEHCSDLCCTMASHEPLRKAVRKAQLVKLVNKLRRMSYAPGIAEVHETFLKLRKRYRRFWRKT